MLLILLLGQLFIILVSRASTINRIFINIDRPRVIERHPNFYGFSNTPHTFVENARVSYISVCASVEGRKNIAGLRYSWTMTHSSYAVSYLTHSCQFKWQALFEGEYDIVVKIFNASNPNKASATVKTLSDPQDPLECFGKRTIT